MITVLFKIFFDYQRDTYAATGLSQGKNPPTINYTLLFSMSNFHFLDNFFM